MTATARRRCEAMATDGLRLTRIAKIAIGALAVVLAVVVPGYQLAIIVLGGALVTWATFGEGEACAPVVRQCAPFSCGLVRT